jgi:hypothetical protein
MSAAGVSLKKQLRNRQNRVFFVAVVILGATLSIHSQDVTSAPNIFISLELGFRYNPPADLIDFPTLSSKLDTLKVLLLRRSGLDDRLPDWRSLSIETYPRAQLRNPSDLYADLMMAKMVVGLKATELGTPSDETIGPFHFVISQFQFRDARALKYGRIYTTVLRGQLVSFAFAATSYQVLDKLASSVKTIAPLSPVRKRHHGDYPNHGARSAPSSPGPVMLPSF